MSSYEYECAISGAVAPGVPFVDEELEDQPLGWTKVTMQRRILNPEWVAIQRTKQALLNGMMQSIPEEHREVQLPYVQVQLKAQFFAYEAVTPRFIVDVHDVVYVSESEEVTEALNEVREGLGLEPVPAPVLLEVEEAQGAETETGDE